MLVRAYLAHAIAEQVNWSANLGTTLHLLGDRKGELWLPAAKSNRPCLLWTRGHLGTSQTMIAC